tara:strand:- start:44 stop:523 length:480 start_codon:yes stop_codon:yes gene_type:complete
MKLSDTLLEETILYPFQPNDKQSAIKSLLNRLMDLNYLTATSKLFSLIDEHDKLMNPAVGRGIAYHYSNSIEVDSPVAAFGISKDGIDYNSPDSQKVHFIFLILDSVNEPSEHRKLITRFQHFINDSEMKTKILSSQSPIDVMDIIINWEKNYLFNEKI